MLDPHFKRNFFYLYIIVYEEVSKSLISQVVNRSEINLIIFLCYAKMEVLQAKLAHLCKAQCPFFLRKLAFQDERKCVWYIQKGISISTLCSHWLREEFCWSGPYCILPHKAGEALKVFKIVIVIIPIIIMWLWLS